MTKILLILGGGPNIGAAVAKSFSAAGYKVASASRSAPKSTEGIDLHVPVDLSKPDDVPGVFEKVRKELGEPGVVVYNGRSRCPSLFLMRTLHQHSISSSLHRSSLFVTSVFEN
jgi:NAD(P)-dependent dehydrogenase (short-subunit alcohol dehydrogenase family)